eukprot:gnl/TRDRNA2_/TRDRNA2_176064_c3_seq16.p1 gnl/TRDRNA2_/TRDRNA2_176064_c3~~gnl/TRDRNA2_/TRDRNA2_176064_c3_seq16.p1  ORF type:complete len:111 (-),score=8.46 gnl/TRDRNA2_/TRDRNA2_176064_c3_seq16:26-358(-)
MYRWHCGPFRIVNMSHGVFSPLRIILASVAVRLAVPLSSCSTHAMERQLSKSRSWDDASTASAFATAVATSHGVTHCLLKSCPSQSGRRVTSKAKAQTGPKSPAESRGQG